MQRSGSPLQGASVVFWKELADNLTSTRMRLLEVLIVIAGVAAIYASIGRLTQEVGEDPFIFLHVFTVARAPLPSFVAFLGFLIPIVAIALGFDAVNNEFNSRTMSRILAQPIYRDAFLFGKFLAGLATLAIVLAALWLLVTGLALLTLGVPPSGEEVGRSLAFLCVAIAYGGVWLALAITFSVICRQPATAALAGLAVWLVFTFFWQMIVPIATNILAPIDPFNPMTQLHAINVALGLNRISPNALFDEITLALLSPSTRTLGPIFADQLQGALIGAPLPLGQSLLLAWPQFTGLVAGVVLLFTCAYVLFQRQEVRA